MSFPVKHIVICGAGLVGSLLGIVLAKRGYRITIFEKRRDPRLFFKDDGRSINLAVSDRGFRSLVLVGMEEKVKSFSIPMKGRIVHDLEGNTSFQAYDTEGRAIYSVSRAKLNLLLIEELQNYANVEMLFEHSFSSLDARAKTVSITAANAQQTILSYDFLFGSDGAYSAIRQAMQGLQSMDVRLEKLSHSYKELTMPAVKGNFQVEANGLHIWPRGKFMFIALPNQDGSFTCTLFLPHSGENSFEKLHQAEEVQAFFKSNFPDALRYIPEMLTDYLESPVSSLATLYAYPWEYQNSIMLIGDAAHAIVPFYGQGMNAGFEDVRLLAELLDKNQDHWEGLPAQFQQQRKPDSDAIAALALQNFVEMRDNVAQADFVKRKKIEAQIHQRYPHYLPLYTMVTFSHIPYAEAWKAGQKHDELMAEIMQMKIVQENEQLAPDHWQQLEEVLKKYGVV